MITVSEIMTSEVICINPNDVLVKAWGIMVEKRVRHLPVVDAENKLLGIVTQRDILRASDSANPQKPLSLSTVGGDKALVSEIMTEKVKVARPDGSLRSAGLELQRYKIGCLPVVEDEKVVGIITDVDFVGVAINLIEQMDGMENQNEF